MSNCLSPVGQIARIPFYPVTGIKYNISSTTYVCSVLQKVSFISKYHQSVLLNILAFTQIACNAWIIFSCPRSKGWHFEKHTKNRLLEKTAPPRSEDKSEQQTRGFFLSGDTLLTLPKQRPPAAAETEGRPQEPQEKAADH